MHRWRWLIHIILKSLAYRQGRSLLLLGVLAMAASLVTALGIVSSSMGERVADEVRKYLQMILQETRKETARLRKGK